MGDVGPFSLAEELGAGGAGTVFRAVHRGSGLPVALKVMHAEEGTTPLSLLHEVQVTAALHHPRIVRIHDFGRVTDEEADPTRGIRAGETWMATEYCDGGALSGWSPDDWPALRSVLLQILDGLAHAHARGLLHGDIKPGNVLRAAGSRGVKLGDLGIAARYAERPEDMDRVSGTPAYMAPELWTGDWRKIGPATDLYAVGCLAWKLLCGRTPFKADSVASMALAHRNHRPRGWEPWIEAPSGLEDWVRTLLAKNPRSRWDRAADAARALLTLGDAVDAETLADLSATWDEPMATIDLPTLTRPVARQRGPASVEGQAPASSVHTPPWRPPREPPPLQEPSGLGAELLPLRVPPLIGRESERDLLWELWSAVRRGAEPDLVTIGGTLGSGRRALAHWFAERVLELGAGDVLRVDPTDGLVDALTDAVCRFLRVDGLQADEMGPWLRAWLADRHIGDRDDATLLETLTLRTARDASSELLVSPPVHKTMLIRALGLIARRRGLLLVIDGPGSSAEIGDFLRAMHATGDGKGVLCVAVSPPGEAATITLAPLPGQALRRLGVSGFGLAQTLSLRIAEAVDGNPGAFVATVQELARTGNLVPSPGGLTSEAALPTLTDDLWGPRVGRLLATLAPDVRASLAVGAVIGEVRPDVWAHACSLLDLVPADDALAALSRLGAVALEGGARESVWRTVHPGVRTALLGTGSLAAIHGAVADAFAATGVAPARRGRHLLGAGRNSEAFDEFLSAAEIAARREDLGRARTYADRAEAAASHLPPSSRRDVRLLLLRARMGVTERRPADALALALEAVDRAEAAGLRRLASEAAQHAGHSAHYLADLDASARYLVRAERDARAVGDLVLACEIAQDLAGVEHSRGQLDASEAALQRAAADAENGGSRLSFKSVQLQLVCQALGARGQFTEVIEALTRGLDDPEVSYSPVRRAHTLHTLGVHQFQAGALAASRRAFEEAAHLYARFGHPDVQYAEVNLAMLLLEAGQADEAEPVLERAEVLLRGTDNLLLLIPILARRLELVALRHDQEAFAIRVAELHELLDRTSGAGRDILDALDRAHETMRNAGLREADALGSLIAAQRDARG